MPDALTYPGVYIEELPSPVHTIIGVPTATTAFVGGAARGPVNEPVSVSSIAEYGQWFGGDGSLPLDRAVGLFYQNGGGDAVIVRVRGASAQQATIPKDKPALELVAASPGEWGDHISITLDQENVPKKQNTDPPGAPNDSNTYNLTAVYTPPFDGTSTITERYVGISINPSSPRSLQRTLAGSTLIAYPTPPANPNPPAGPNPNPPAGPNPNPPAGPNPNPPAGHGLTLPLPDGKLDFNLETGAADLPQEPDLLAGFANVANHNTFFNMLVLTPVWNAPPAAAAGSATPPTLKDEVDSSTLAKAAKFAKDHRAMLIVDPPLGWKTVSDAKDHRDDFFNTFGENKTNAAVYFPRVVLPDPKGGTIRDVGPSAAIAGLFAATDSSRGVWKAPAGIGVQLGGVVELSVRMSDAENGRLNPVAVNCLRSLPVVGNVVWGARTMAGDDISASQWKYIPVRRLALYIEESLYRGTQWVVFEPNDEPLWAQVRLNVGAFMHTLFRRGAFQGTTAKDAYFVKCDKDTNPQADIDSGILNVIVGFAPLKPAEFVVIKIQQITGQIEV